MASRGPGGGRGGRDRGDQSWRTGGRGRADSRGRGGGDSWRSGSRGRGPGTPSSGSSPSRYGTGSSSRSSPSRGSGRGGPPGSSEVYTPPDGSSIQPSEQVTRKEDEFQKALASEQTLGLQKLGLKERFPLRPGYGTRGTPIVLYANYLEFIPRPDLPIYSYSLDFNPVVAGRKREQIVNLLLQEPQFERHRRHIVTDGKNSVISCVQLDIQDVFIIYKAELEDEPAPAAPTYRVRFGETRQYNVSDCINFLNSTDLSRTYGDKDNLLQALNIWLNSYAKTADGIIPVGTQGQNKAVALNAPQFNLGAGLTAWRGFFSSMRVATARILVNINVAHRVFWEPGDLEKLYNKYRPAVGSNNIALQSSFSRLRVETTHLPVRKNKAGKVIPKIKTVVGFANMRDGKNNDHPPRIARFAAGPKDVSFWMEDRSKGKRNGKKDKGSPGEKPSGGGNGGGKYITVFDYFARTYGISNINFRLPVINVGTTANPSYLIMEVCKIFNGQTARTALPPAQTAAMIKFAVRKPHENANSIIHDGVRTVGLTEDVNAAMTAWGVQIPRKFVTVPGRILDGPQVNYRNNKAAGLAKGSWDLRGVQFNTGVTIRNWAAVLIGPGAQRGLDNRDKFISATRAFHGGLQRCGITIDAPRTTDRIHVYNPDDPSIENVLRDAAATAKAPDVPMVLFVFPEYNVKVWKRIKMLGDTKYGVHTNCVLSKHFGNVEMPKFDNPQYFANVGCKINQKLGGLNQRVDNIPLIRDGNTMLMGADVTHPAPGSSGSAPSVAGMVGSVDKHASRYIGEVRIQRESRKEMIDELTSMSKVLLQKWRTVGKNATLPTNILLYRDGVSEGQYSQVVDEELPQLQQACREIYPPADTANGLPKIFVALVGKRHHTRFYPTQPENADRSSNPKNGTVVDRHITDSRTWDFFLQAHAAIHGTARPAHYIVVYDQVFNSITDLRKHGVQGAPFRSTADLVEHITHALCYSYGRATKAVSMAPPAYHADLLCERARVWLGAVYGEGSERGSSLEGEGAGGGSAGRGEDLVVHERVRDCMFWC